MATDTQLAPTDAEIAALRSEFGITSNGRGIKEFTQVRDFARAVLARWGAQPIPPSAAEFALQALVAAGHVSQELVDKAMALPGAPQTQQLGWVYCYQGQEPAFSYTPQPPGIPKTHYWQVPVFDVGRSRAAQEHSDE